MRQYLIYTGPFCSNINCINCRPEGFDCDGHWTEAGGKTITDPKKINELNKIAGVTPCKRL